MQLGTIHHGGTTRAVRVDRDTGEAVLLDAVDVGQLLAGGGSPSGNEPVDGSVEEAIDLSDVQWAPVVTRPNKIICVGPVSYTHLTLPTICSV